MERDREREEGGGEGIRFATANDPACTRTVAHAFRGYARGAPPALDAATVFSRTAGAPMRPAIRCAQMRRADEGGSARR